MPTVASYCTTFLKPEMLHIYRQVTGLQRYDTFVVCKERQCEDSYPFDDVEIAPWARSNFVRRFHLKYIRQEPPSFTAANTVCWRACSSGIRRPDARLFRPHRRASAAVYPPMAASRRWYRFTAWTCRRATTGPVTRKTCVRFSRSSDGPGAFGIIEAHG